MKAERLATIRCVFWALNAPTYNAFSFSARTRPRGSLRRCIWGDHFAAGKERTGYDRATEVGEKPRRKWKPWLRPWTQWTDLKGRELKDYVGRKLMLTMRPSDDRLRLAACCAHQLETLAFSDLSPPRLRQQLVYCRHHCSSNNHVITFIQRLESIVNYFMMTSVLLTPNCYYI